MSDKETNECSCHGGPKLIFPCSGASDLGAISDGAGRMMTRNGDGKMFCLAGIGGRVDSIIESTKQASKILAIDGCKEDCARKTLELAGFSKFCHLRLTDMGMEKGNTPVTRERVLQVVNEGKHLIDAESTERETT